MTEQNDAVDFADLVTALVDETFDAILDSQAEQHRKRDELSELVAMSDDEFADEFITPADIRKAAAHLLGNATLVQFTLQLSKGAAEVQADAEARGLATLELIFDGKPVPGWLIAAVKKRKAAALRPVFQRPEWSTYLTPILVAEQKLAFQNLLDRGVPRVVVDSGRIAARAKFTVARSVSTTETPPQAAEAGSTARSLSRRRLGRDGRKRGVKVRMVRSGPPQPATGGGRDDSQESEQEIELELEIQFRTED